MKTIKRLVQVVFYLLALAMLLGRAVTQVVSHDENQFIAAGQMIADQGWLPYRDFPYTHMPYGIFLYALSAKVSSYDCLAARLLGTLTWLGCIALLVVILRLITRREPLDRSPDPSWALLLGEFTLIVIFLLAPISSYVLGAALNHSFGTFFSLLAFLLFLRGITRQTSLRSAAFWSGICISIAACMRLNYAGLILILFVLWLLYVLTSEPGQLIRWLVPFFGGVVLAALPALVLAALAPAHSYYGNIVYIQLNTLYYRGILFKQTMDLPSKIHAFLNNVLHSPIDVVLYSIVIVAGIAFLIRFARRRSTFDLIGLSAAGFAGTLFLTAFSPTPTQEHYFFAPLPFMLVMIWVLGSALYQRGRYVYLAACVALLVVLTLTVRRSDPLGPLAALSKPSSWPPLQVHEFAESLRQYTPPGRLLTLLPMLTGEAGYTPYPFAATGPFSWRTSLLLAPSRRLDYGVTSPEELPPLLDSTSPVAILTGLEAPNAGFKFGDLGGLETPFVDYARQHGFKPVTLSPAFLEQPITLWLRQP